MCLAGAEEACRPGEVSVPPGEHARFSLTHRPQGARRRQHDCRHVREHRGLLAAPVGQKRGAPRPAGAPPRPRLSRGDLRVRAGKMGRRTTCGLPSFAAARSELRAMRALQLPLVPQCCIVQPRCAGSRGMARPGVQGTGPLLSPAIPTLWWHGRSRCLPLAPGGDGGGTVQRPFEHGAAPMGAGTCRTFSANRA